MSPSWPGPPDADELVHRELGLDRFGDGSGVHRAPAPHQHEVRLFAADLQPLRRLVLHFLQADRDRQEREAVLGGERLEQRDRLLAVGMVEMQQDDLLALQVVEIAVGDVVQDHRRAIPIGGRRIEGPLEHLAVGHRREAVARRQDRDLVDIGLGQDLQRDAGRPGLGHDAAWPWSSHSIRRPFRCCSRSRTPRSRA